MFTIKKKTNVPKTIRFTDELNEKLCQIAADEGVSFNELVLQCCQYALNDYGKKVKFNVEKQEDNKDA